MQHKLFRHTSVSVDAIIGFYHNEACITRTRSCRRVRRGRAGGAAGDACSQSDGQSGRVVPPGLPLRRKDRTITREKKFKNQIFSANSAFMRHIII